jgi:non-ribosomal peptide synthetase component F
MRLCNDKEIGQICIAGEGLALGYLNDPQLTKLKFKEVIIQGAKKRLYLASTGDLGFWKEGLLHFHGRKDRQLRFLDIKSNFPKLNIKSKSI